MAKDIGIGVIGLGMGQSVLSINDDPDSRLKVVAVCDADASRARTIATRHNIGIATTDYVELCMLPEVQVVAIYSPDNLHYEHAMTALTSRRHVICTKPFTDSLERARELAEEADRRDVRILVGQTSRWRADFVAAQSVCANGDLGDLRVVEAHYVHDMRPVLDRTPWRWEMPQDFVYGGLCHPIDLLRWIAGEIVEVHALGRNSAMDVRYLQLPDNILVNVRFASGAIGRVMGLFGCVEPAMPMLGLSLFGTKGSLANDRVVLDRVAGRPPMTFLLSDADATHKSEVHGYLRHFEDCLAMQKKPLVDGWDAARTIAVCSAVHDSLRTGLPARVMPVGAK